MYCKYCGKEHNDESLFCSYCGEQITEKKEENKPAKCWSVFAKVGFVLGIITIATCWIPIFGLYSLLPGIHGIVFAALGNKANQQPFMRNATTGLALSIVGTILSIVCFIGLLACIASME